MVRLTIQPADELQRLLDQGERRQAKALLDLVVAIAKRQPTEILEARSRLHDAIWEDQALADLHARRRTLLYARNLSRKAQGGLSTFAEKYRPEDVARVPFEDAIADFVSREPALAPTADAIVEVYKRHGFSLVRAAEQETVRRVQATIAKALRLGTAADPATAAVEALGDWSRAYAGTVFRNAQTSAYTAGIFRELRDPDVSAVIGALELHTAGDNDVRRNHKAADGLVAAPDDPIWHRCAPPNGHNCRCGLRFVDRGELERRGLLGSDGRVRRASLPRGFYRDPGFVGGRPDLSIYEF